MNIIDIGAFAMIGFSLAMAVVLVINCIVEERKWRKSRVSFNRPRK